MPSFKSSPNKNTFFSIPYLKVLAQNKDMTVTQDYIQKLMVQTEVREVIKKNKSY